MFRTPRRTFAVAALSALFVARSGLAAPAEKEVAPDEKRDAASPQVGVDRKPFGKTADGQPVEIYTLTNEKGETASILTYGAILSRVRVPDRTGKVNDVLLGYSTLAQYEKDAGPYFGALVGRVANRIAKGTFTLDGKTYHIPVNNGPNALHGGTVGYDKRLWTAEPVESKDGPALRLQLTDPDGDQGFPGTVHVTVTYQLLNTGTLRISYEATTDKATPINLTSHGYWNLNDGGKSTILDTVMRWHADKYLPVDDVQIPTGQVAPVEGTPFDFRKWKAIGKDIAATGGTPPGYDHCMVIDGPRGELRPAVEVYEGRTGRTMEVYTTAPGMQFYTGNFLDGTIVGRYKVPYAKYHAFALEAQDFPDAINHPSFPSCVLKPGETYHQTTEYRFGLSDHEPK